MDFLLLAGAVLGVFAVCFTGIGLGILAGRRKRLGACSCSFDADKQRRDACCRRGSG